MGISTNINLIKKSSGLPEYLVPLQNQYRNFSILALFVVFVAGVCTVVAFLIIQVQVQNVTRQKNIASRRLEAQKSKENTYLAIKSRISVVETALKSSHQKSILVTDAMTVAGPPKLLGLNESTDKKLNMNYNCSTIEDCIIMTNTLLTLDQDKILKNISMDSFTLNQKGINISFNSIPIWPE